MNTENLIDPSIAGFVKPNFEYKGIILSKFTAGKKILFSQASISDDQMRNSGHWISLALIFLLTLKKEEAQNLAFNRPYFREKAIEWFEKIDGDGKEITDLAEEIFTQGEQTKVSVTDGGTDPKNA